MPVTSFVHVSQSKRQENKTLKWTLSCFPISISSPYFWKWPQFQQLLLPQTGCYMVWRQQSDMQVLFCMASAVASSQAEATRPRYYPLSLLVDTPRRQQSQSLLERLHGCSAAGPACTSGRPLSHLPGQHEQVQGVKRSSLRIGVFKAESRQFLKGCWGHGALSSPSQKKTFCCSRCHFSTSPSCTLRAHTQPYKQPYNLPPGSGTGLLLQPALGQLRFASCKWAPAGP